MGRRLGGVEERITHPDLRNVLGAQLRVLEQMVHLVIDLDWPLIIEQVQIESLGRHLVSVLHKSTVNYRRMGPTFGGGQPIVDAGEDD